MKGWILDIRDRWNEYEHHRFREEARKEDIEICLYDPRDFDIQITVKGGRSLTYDGDKPYILEVNPLPGLNPDYSDLCIEAAADGWRYEELVNRILDEAKERYQLNP